MHRLGHIFGQVCPQAHHLRQGDSSNGQSAASSCGLGGCGIGDRHAGRKLALVDDKGIFKAQGHHLRQGDSSNGQAARLGRENADVRGLAVGLVLIGGGPLQVMAPVFLHAVRGIVHSTLNARVPGGDRRLGKAGDLPGVVARGHSRGKAQVLAAVQVVEDVVDFGFV